MRMHFTIYTDCIFSRLHSRTYSKNQSYKHIWRLTCKIIENLNTFAENTDKPNWANSEQEKKEWHMDHTARGAFLPRSTSNVRTKDIKPVKVMWSKVDADPSNRMVRCKLRYMTAFNFRMIWYYVATKRILFKWSAPCPIRTQSLLITYTWIRVHNWIPSIVHIQCDWRSFFVLGDIRVHSSLEHVCNIGALDLGIHEFDKANFIEMAN